MPDAAIARSGSASPSRSIPSVITVDSPPGSTSASSPSRSAGNPHLPGLGTEPRQHALVRLETALEREDPDQRRVTHQPRDSSSCPDSSLEVSMLSIAAPSPVDAAATRAGSAKCVVASTIARARASGIGRLEDA